MSFLIPLSAIFRRDLRLAVSYRLEFVMRTFSALFSVVLWYYLSIFLKPGEDIIGGKDYFTYVVIGMALLGYINLMLYTFSQKIRQDQMVGTLEFIVASPTSPALLLFSSTIWEMVMESLHLSIYLMIALVFGAAFKVGAIFPLAVVFALTLMSFGSLGIIAASFLIVFKRGEPVTPFIAAFFALLGNIFFPAKILPPALKTLSMFMPLPYSVDAVRKLLTAGAGWQEVLPEISALLVFCLFLVPAAILSLNLSLKLARRYGLLSMY
ncbi:MAG TPA: ABC transporter permease [Acidobacteriota bacterium]|nr:ABC transporter permease [Acidobacteriota bacterium]HNT18223.1 ABC transporter permease [Acidobacteriota bacterium]HPA27310.1 ABC transporter permease [Acidobacteriota bacterium]HQO20743.1 ABC transporter permease [Acidobacteriota bacterium]HQQ45792.1 ABC transporter permease [Acidobacteriota bacterium]